MLTLTGRYNTNAIRKGKLDIAYIQIQMVLMTILNTYSIAVATASCSSCKGMLRYPATTALQCIYDGVTAAYHRRTLTATPTFIIPLSS